MYIARTHRNLLGFSGRETNGFLILLPLILIIVSAEPLYRTWVSNRINDYSDEERTLDSLVALWEVEIDTAKSIAKKEGVTLKRLFKFDPNTASQEQLAQLGFPLFLAKRVVTYRQKGGKFSGGYRSCQAAIRALVSMQYDSIPPYHSAD